MTPESKSFYSNEQHKFNKSAAEQTQTLAENGPTLNKYAI